MAKVISFSRKFPGYHFKSGQPTFFVEKFLNQLGVNYLCDNYLQKLLVLNTKNIAKGKLSFEDIESFFLSLQETGHDKFHTIRGGKRWKVNDFFSPRCWFGRPYFDPQIIFWDDVEVKSLTNIFIYSTNKVFLNQQFWASFGSENWNTLCENDGLNSQEMKAWFCKLPFDGQIIGWTDKLY